MARPIYRTEVVVALLHGSVVSHPPVPSPRRDDVLSNVRATSDMRVACRRLGGMGDQMGISAGAWVVGRGVFAAESRWSG